MVNFNGGLKNGFCQTCFFFEYMEKQISLSFVQGHCKLLEMIHNKSLVKCSGIEGCIANYNLHTLESELTDDQKKNFNNYYCVRNDLLKKLNFGQNCEKLSFSISELL